MMYDDPLQLTTVSPGAPCNSQQWQHEGVARSEASMMMTSILLRGCLGSIQLGTVAIGKSICKCSSHTTDSKLPLVRHVWVDVLEICHATRCPIGGEMTMAGPDVDEVDLLQWSYGPRRPLNIGTYV